MSKKEEIKICPFPFSRIEHGNQRNEFVPCCYAWFKDGYKDLTLENMKNPNIWNSAQAQKLRASMLDGSFKYCNLDRCNKPIMSLKEIEEMDPAYFETPISTANMEAILAGKVRLPDPPSSISLNSDYKCNLKCPTCRSDYITKTYPNDQKQIDQEVNQLLDAKESVQVIKMANNGEAFFSKDMRKLLKYIGPDTFPNLEHIFVITNGLLFDANNFQQLLPGSGYIKKVAISMDAGNESTYKKTRGGSWHKLMQNLDWVSTERKSGKFNTFNLNFVVRKENYKSIDDFIELGRKLGVDRFEFTKFDNWQAMYNANIESPIIYEDEAIHLKDHKDHLELLSILGKYKDNPDVAINIDGLF